MPEVASGAFWDATIYSPKAKGNLSLPVKQNLLTGNYGGYSREQFAYFFAFKTFEPKGKRYAFAFEPVPVRIASQIESNGAALERYAETLCEGKGLQLVEIVRPRICKYQLIEFDGDRMYIVGKREVRNATQIAISQAETRILKSLFDGRSVGSKECKNVFASISRSLRTYGKRLVRVLNLDRIEDEFSNLSDDEMCAVLKSLMAIASAKTNRVDLSSVGGSRCSGCMQPSIAMEMSSKESGFAFIDQSVTGMFESRQVVNL